MRGRIGEEKRKIPTSDSAPASRTIARFRLSSLSVGAVFLFFYFLFLFFKKYIFDLEIYRNIPGRPAAGRQGLTCKKKDENKLQTGPWEPAARQLGGPARQRGGRVYFCKFLNRKYIFVKNENKK